MIDCHVTLTGPGDIQIAGLVLDRTHVFMEIIVEWWGSVRVVVVAMVWGCCSVVEDVWCHDGICGGGGSGNGNRCCDDDGSGEYLCCDEFSSDGCDGEDICCDDGGEVRFSIEDVFF